VASGAWLSDQQRRHAARIAREKGLSCPDCGASEPVPRDEARAHPGGGADVVMRCVNCESASETTLVLSPEEAKALGLGQALQDDSEVP
jgi:predicted kinase